MRNRAGSVAAALLLVLGSAVMLLPFWWMCVTSLSTPAEASASATAGAFRWWPTDPQWMNYPDALRRMGSQPAPTPDSDAPQREWRRAAAWWWQRLRPSRGFVDALANSVVITTLSVVGQVLSCSLVGYALARLRFRGRRLAFGVMIATMMLPVQATIIPLFLLFRAFGWIDTILPLVVPLFFGTPYFIFMFRQFFAQVPESLLEAARLDGCGHFRIWRQIMLPLCKPVVALTAIFTFIYSWNDFMAPLIYLHSEDQMTLAVALNSFQNQYGDFRDAHLLMAASVVTMIPCAVLFLVAQKQLVRGLLVGSVKG